MIATEPPGIVLTDLQMPKLNGLRLVSSMRKKHPSVPVVLMTSHGSEEIVLEALQAGAASYLSKRNLDAKLADTLERVYAASCEQDRKHALLGRLDHVEFAFTLENERESVPDLVAHLHPYLERMGLADHSTRTRIGIAPEKALLNGMYHGNLELSSDLRQNGDEPFYRAAEEHKRVHLPADEMRQQIVAFGRVERHDVTSRTAGAFVAASFSPLPSLPMARRLVAKNRYASFTQL